MKGALVAIVIMMVILLIMCIVYKRINHRNMLKDLLSDIFGK